MFNLLKVRNAVAPIVAISLLLVVSVVSVLSFQGWFTNFSSSVVTDIDQQIKTSNSNLKVEGLINGKLYLNSNSNEDLDINFLKVYDDVGVEVCSISNSDNNSNLNISSYWDFGSNYGILEDSVGNFDGNLNGYTKLLINFDNGSIEDLSGYDVNVNSVGNPNCSVEGIYGNGCDLSEDGTRVEIDFSSSDIDVLDFTFSVWLKPNSSNVSDTPSIIEGTSQSPRLILWNSGNDVNLNLQILNDTNDWHGITNNINKSNFVGNWYNVVAVFSGNNLKYYFNGDLIGELNYTGDLKDFNSLRVSSRDGSIEFNGTIDDIVFYSTALSSSDVLKLYNSRKGKILEFEKKSNKNSLVFKDEFKEGAVFPNFLNGKNEFTLLLNVDSYKRNVNESLTAVVNDNAGIYYPRDRFDSNFIPKLNKLGFNYVVDNVSSVYSLINLSNKNVGCFSSAWACRNFSGYQDLYAGEFKIFTSGNDNGFWGSNNYLSNESVSINNNYGFYNMTSKHPIGFNASSFQPSSGDNRRGITSIFPGVKVIGFDSVNNYYETIYQEDIFGSRWYNNQATYTVSSSYKVNSNGLEFVYRNAFLSGGELINLYEFNGKVVGFLNDEKVEFDYTDSISQVGLSLKNNVLSLIVNGKIVSNSTISSFDNSIENSINLGPDSGVFESMVLYDDALNESDISLIFDSSLFNLNSGLTKVDLNNCNLEKGNKYNILTGTSDGLNDVSVIVK